MCLISNDCKCFKETHPHFAFYPAYLSCSFRHRTGEASLAGLGDDGPEHLRVRTQTEPGLLHRETTAANSNSGPSQLSDDRANKVR